MAPSHWERTNPLAAAVESLTASTARMTSQLYLFLDDFQGASGASALDDSDMARVNFKTYDQSKLMNALSRRDDPILAAPGGDGL
jgi:hypothetical protein